MDRKATARETLRILEQGYYLYGDQRISIEEAHEKSVKESVLITPEEDRERKRRESAKNGKKES